MNRYVMAIAALVLAVAFGGCVYLALPAQATVYSFDAPALRIKATTRPATALDSRGPVPIGHCKSGGSSPVTCPHDGETNLWAGKAVAKTSTGVTMVGWDWVTCGQWYNAATATNVYTVTFDIPGTSWPAVLPTGCAGGPCPQFPAKVYCQFTGDNPPGPQDWTGHSINQPIDVANW